MNGLHLQLLTFSQHLSYAPTPMFHRNDWRYRLLVRRLSVFKRKWVQLPRIMLYLALLGDRIKVECWTRSAHRLYYRYSPRQQGMMLEALSRVRLQDQVLFKKISDWLQTRLQSPKVSRFYCRGGAWLFRL